MIPLQLLSLLSQDSFCNRNGSPYLPSLHKKQRFSHLIILPSIAELHSISDSRLHEKSEPLTDMQTNLIPLTKKHLLQLVFSSQFSVIDSVIVQRLQMGSSSVCPLQSLSMLSQISLPLLVGVQPLSDPISSIPLSVMTDSSDMMSG